MNMKMKYLLIIVMTAFLTSCATTNHRFFRADVVGFSDKPTTSYDSDRGLFMNLKPQSDPYDLLFKPNMLAMQHAVQSTPRGDNTTVYYAMELAAMRVKYIRRKVAKNDPETKYYIFLLTDGLDNASSQVAKNEKRILFNRTPEQYQKRVQRKLKGAMGLFHKNTFEVYPMMYEGEDMQEMKVKNNLSDTAFKKMLADDMACFRYSSRGNEYAPELISSDDYTGIFNQLRNNFCSSSYTFRVPKSYANKSIRMTFVNRDGEQVIMTAQLKKSLFSYRLKNIQFSDGVTISDKNLVRGKTDVRKSEKAFAKEDNVNVYFVIEDFRLNDIVYYPVKESVTQEYESRPGIWQPNSEYREVTEVNVDTYYILVIDGSNSLDGKNGDMEGFKMETNMALQIMEIVSPLQY